MYLAGDVGGTNTRLALVEESGGRFDVRAVAVYESASQPGIEPLLGRFLSEHPAAVRAIGLGLPGPVTGRVVTTTNLPWHVDQDAIERLVGAPCRLVNDLAAAAHGTLVLPPDGLAVLQAGEPAAGNRAVIAAGTGLGEAVLFRQGDSWYPSASEGGHASFAPRDEEEIELWRFAGSRFGHVSFERLVSGAGLVLIYEFYRHRRGDTGPLAWAAGQDQAAAVARAAADGSDVAAARALARFCTIYGGEAANLALKVLATGGVFVAGGIAPKILPFLERGEFLAGFLDKGRYRAMLARMPVAVVTDDYVGLRGAARAAHILVG